MAIYNNSRSEIAFYETYFGAVHLWVNDLHSIVRIAMTESQKNGIKALDALHLAAARVGEADAFYTLERPESPIHRTSLVRVSRLTGV